MNEVARELRRRDPARRRRRRHHRRGRGLRPRRPGRARLPRANRTGTRRCSGRRDTRTSTARTASTGASTSCAAARASRPPCCCARSSRRDGLERMRKRRGLDEVRLLCSGPGRLCQALGVTREHDGLRLDRPPFEIHAPTEETVVTAAPRIGITRAAELPWRYLRGRLALPQPARASRLDGLCCSGVPLAPCDDELHPEPGRSGDSGPGLLRDDRPGRPVAPADRGLELQPSRAAAPRRRPATRRDPGRRRASPSSRTGRPRRTTRGSRAAGSCETTSPGRWPGFDGTVDDWAPSGCAARRSRAAASGRPTTLGTSTSLVLQSAIRFGPHPAK